MIFSIIIPIYNVEKYLRECLDSVVRQSFANWEAICVDDGSTDGSKGIVEEYASKDDRFRLVSQQNAGTAAARNTGLRAAQGDYIFFLDSDDWIEPDALQTIAAHLNGEDILCFSGKRYFEATGSYNPADQLLEKRYETGMDYYNENALLPRDFAFVCVVLRVYRRGFVLDNRLFFDNDVSFEDNLWVPIVMFHASTVKVIPESLYVYRVRQGSKMQDVSFARRKDKLTVANRLAAFFVLKTGIEKTVVYRAITHHYQAVFVGAAKDERKELKQLCDWRLYRVVSRTKLRHRVNYWKNRVK